jgi:hypothetical protein
VLPYCGKSDGMSIVEKASTARNNSKSKRKSSSAKNPTVGASSAAVLGAGYSGAQPPASESGNNGDISDTEVFSPDRSHDLLQAPEKKRGRGLPTNARDKPNYEIKDKRSRFCTICRGKGHKCTTCPMRGDLPPANRKEPRCSNCGLTGHRKTSCSKAMHFRG